MRVIVVGAGIGGLTASVALAQRGHQVTLIERAPAFEAIGAGLLVAGSALWMTLFYEQKAGTTDLLYAVRLVFSAGMAACVVLGVSSVRRGDLAAHRAWMIRAYAIAVAAGTQAFTVGLGGALIGTSGIRYDALMGAAWVINLGIAEWAIRRPARRARRAHAAALAQVLA